MLGIGWTEMLVVAIAALIIVGPRDLPRLLGQLGRAAGVLRRMSNEFRREVNRAVALDEVRDIRKSITEPIKQATADITKEFNKTTATGVEPTGAIKPSDPNAESVVDEIKAKVGMNVSPAVASTLPGVVSTQAAKPVEEPVRAAQVTKPRPAEPAIAPEPAPEAAAKPVRKPRAAAKPAASEPEGEQTKPSRRKRETVADESVGAEPAPKRTRAKKAQS